VETIGNNAFWGCTSLESIEILASAVMLDNNVFHNTPWLDAQPDGLVYIGSVLYTYKGTMPAGTGITVPDGTTSIAGSALREQENLTSVIIPASVITIGPNALRACANLATVTFAPESRLKTIGFSAFMDSGIIEIIIPAGVTTVGHDIFIGWAGTQTVIIKGYADKDATIAAGWDSRWDDYTSADIIYQP